ncbi:multidrug resistance-associated protein 1 isoform X3 [Bombyx mori]|uniref:ABC-type glutathione-S-conjugate transporter n=1 Tax=Bombyx mori TaxID=7091 RepID=A0A8R2HQ67_BOMMO|nr:multidrug resistance-associated protein 1 isoform X3 [Bombyx mori]XP_037870235.1 multidrug resistance-associated protein 1 isoform X3 [Bombyx mori]
MNSTNNVSDECNRTNEMLHFQSTVLIWSPYVYLWLATAFEVYYFMTSREKNIPWTVLNITKLVMITLLVILKCVDFGMTIYFRLPQTLAFQHIMKILTFTLSASLVWLNKKHGMRASGVLFFFWLLLAVIEVPRLWCKALELKMNFVNGIQYGFISLAIHYGLIVLLLILNCFADAAPRDSVYTDSQNQCPERSAGFLSRLTFSWFDSLVLKGYRKEFEEGDVWDLNYQESSSEVVPRFKKYWEQPANRRNSSTKHIKAKFRRRSTDRTMKTNTKNRTVSILPALCFAFGGQFMFGTFLKLLSDISIFLSPQLLKLLIGFISSDEPTWRGYLYSFLFFGCAALETTLLSHYTLKMNIVGMRIRTALTNAIYQMALRMNNTTRKQSTVGEIINLMSVDAQRFVSLTSTLNMIWSAPFQIVLAIYFLWGVLGPSVLAGLAVMILLIPMNGFIARMEEKLEIRLMKFKDNRIKIMNEVLNGIKVLKMYAWELSFQGQIDQVRNKELNILKKVIYLDSLTSLTWSATPFLVSLTSFGCFILVNDSESLDSKKLFVALSLFNILRYPLMMLPNTISNIVQTSVSIKRLNKFLNSTVLDLESIEHDPQYSYPITVENGHFSWEGQDSSTVLRNINLRVPRGSLVAIVGAVGAGKSSLLSALLGEMTKVSGRVNVHGTIAYVSQEPWIQNATLKDNILFGKPFNKYKYKNVLNACTLVQDLEIFPGGDLTEIGEKGINLSGGQKQRVSLARAVYHEADNYLLDDPLSAVDSHVGKHIFDKVIGPAGLLKDRTRVWVTHNVSYLAQTDLVVVLRDGQVSEAGSYQHLLEKKGAFADFLLHHLSDAERSSVESVRKQDHEYRCSRTESHQNLQRIRLHSESNSEAEDRSGKLAISFKRSIEEIILNKSAEHVSYTEKEKSERGSVSWMVYKHYLKNIGVLAAAATILMNVVLQLFHIGSSYWLAEWSDNENEVVNSTMNLNQRNKYLAVYAGLGMGQAISSFLADLIPYLACWRAAKVIHELLLDNVLKTPLHFFEVTPIGRILSRFSKDIEIIDSMLPSQLINGVYCVFELIGILFVISLSTPSFLAIVVPVGLVYYVIQRFYVATSRQLKRLESIARSPIFSHFGETISGAATIRAFNVTERFIEESNEKLDRNLAYCYAIVVGKRWLGFRLEFIGNFILFFAAMFAVLSRDTISSGLVGLSLTYAMQVTASLNWLVRLASEIESNIVAVERIKEYSEKNKEAAWNLGKGPGVTWPETGALQLEQLTLEYRPGEPALRDVTCTVAPRDKLGIVGRTGAGKSTLTLGLFRIVEAAAGRILIDGVDIATLGLHQLRSRITIIPQEPILFSGTLRTNLDPFEAYSDEEIWRALEHAHLRAFVQGLPAGLRHEVAEGGENLSVGQRQLVCLARALLRKTPLLVLDEATAAVDLETDDLIQKTIRSEFASCTVLTIAHRLNTIMDSTKVMVLDRGQLVEYAAPQQLLNDKNSIFYSLAKDAGIVS